jgi:hypothetical protein
MRSLAAAAGLSERVVQHIERAEKDSYHPNTLVSIDRALGWALGSAERVLRKGDAPIAMDGQELSASRATVDDMLIDAQGDLIEGLSAAELVEARAAATVAFMAKVREIRTGRQGEGSGANFQVI